MTRPALGSDRVWLWYLAGCGLLIAAYFAIDSPAARLSLSAVLGAGCAAATALGARRHTALAWPWYLMAAGRLSSTAGDVTYWWRTQILHIDTFPAISDALYLSYYLSLAVGTLVLVRARRPGHDGAGLIDALILSTGAAMLTWVYLIMPTLRSSDMSAFARAVSIAYPLADLLVLTMLLRLATGRGGRPPSYYLMVGGMAAVLAGDTAYALLQYTGAYAPGNVVDATWLASGPLLAAAALHPSARTISRRALAVEDGTIGAGRMVALAVASLAAPGVLAVEWLRETPLNVPVIVAGNIMLFLLVILRLRGMVTLLTRALRTAEELANRDPLTGLANRRFFYDRWQGHLGEASTLTALLYVDLDGFKPVNDRYGHEVGDAVLIQVGDRLRGLIRVCDVVARLGGDEFAVILPHTDDASAEAAARRLVTELSMPYRAAGVDVVIGASVGVVTAAPGSDPDGELRRADAAMYAAKTARRTSRDAGRHENRFS